ncbi:MAG: hypothetical protein J5819_00600 [Eubacterium sp.]|nr:hypothetical protein [Eubacterium sp.]
MTGVISGDPVGVGVKVGAGDAVLSIVLTGSSVGRSDGFEVSKAGVIISPDDVKDVSPLGVIPVSEVYVGSDITTEPLFELHANSSKQQIKTDITEKNLFILPSNSEN